MSGPGPATGLMSPGFTIIIKTRRAKRGDGAVVGSVPGPQREVDNK